MPDPTDISDLHQRYQVQASWTRELRRRVFHDVSGSDPTNALEVGTGTGVILADVQRTLKAATVGLDINPEAVLFAKSVSPGSAYLAGDGMDLPFPDNTFDVCLCHYLLMWVVDPLRILQEMRRVTRSGGWVLALAEPDYEGRLDHPPDLIKLGSAQMKSLQRRGVDVIIGRRLASILHRTGLDEITVGILGSEWHGAPPQPELASEWNTLFRDLEGELPAADTQQLLSLDDDAWQEGSRVLFVPTFYGLARVP